MSWPRSDHTKSHTCAEQQRWGEICSHVCFPACLSFSGSTDRRMSCWKWWWHASEAADTMCHPFVTSTLSNPSQKALPLCVCCFACGLPQHQGCVQCAPVSVGAEVCVSLPWQIYWNSQPPCLHWRRCRGREHGPFERLLSFPSIQPPSMPLFHSPADIFLETHWMN